MENLNSAEQPDLLEDIDQDLLDQLDDDIAFLNGEASTPDSRPESTTAKRPSLKAVAEASPSSFEIAEVPVTVSAKPKPADPAPKPVQHSGVVSLEHTRTRFLQPSNLRSMHQLQTDQGQGNGLATTLYVYPDQEEFSKILERLEVKDTLTGSFINQHSPQAQAFLPLLRAVYDSEYINQIPVLQYTDASGVKHFFICQNKTLNTTRNSWFVIHDVVEASTEASQRIDRIILVPTNCFLP